MDNNQPISPTQPVVQPTSPVPDNPQVVSSPPQPEVIEATQSKGGPGSKMILIILAIVFLIILGAGAFYYYQMRQQAVMNLPSPTPQPIASPDPLVSETQNITVEDVDGQFIDIDEDLKQL